MPTSPRENDESGARPWRVEPLRDLDQVDALRAAPGTRLRSGVVDRLLVAQTLVPRALRFLVVAGHHLPTATTPCPHVTGHATGGAVDLTAFVDRSADPRPWSEEPPPYWAAVAEALRSVGMVDGDRWWHWSFGDTRWCERVGAPRPLHDVIA